MSSDIAASVRARLLNKAKASGEEFELTLTRFAAERLLFRIGAFAFKGASLQRAVIACFKRRGTPWTSETPRALTSAFYLLPEIATRWRHYLAAGAVLAPPPAQFEVIGERILQFLGPVRESVIRGDEFGSAWPPEGPWR